MKESNLKKSHGVLSRKGTIMLRSSLGLLSVVSRWNEARYRRGERNGNLKKSTFINTHTFGGRAYPVRHYPIAIRLRTRKGCAILCIALNPQSGYFSGAILGVRSVALLHLGLLPEGDREGTTGRNLKKCTQIDYPTRSKLLEKSKQSKLNTEYSVMNCYRSSFR